MKKKIIALILSITLFCSSGICALGAENNSHEAQTEEAVLIENENSYEQDLCGLREKTEYRQLTEEEYQERQQRSSETEIATYSLEEEAYWKSFSNDYYYNQLNEEEKRAWDELEQKCIAALSGTETVTVISTDHLYFAGHQQDIFMYDFIFMFQHAHPQFYFSGAYASIDYYDINDGYYLELGVYDEFKDGNDRKKATETFFNKIDGWVEQIQQQPAELEEQREKVAYDLICENTVCEAGHSELEQTAYNLVCNGKTTCTGYAAVFQLLMNRVGIETLEIESNSHVWNLINIHGTWYEVDTMYADEENGNINYAYYNKSEDTISQHGNDAVHVVTPFWKQYKPETKYDSLFYEEYKSPYFEAGNYTWFIVNDNASLDGGCLATPVETKNGARYDAAPSTVINSDVTYTTLYWKQDPYEPVKANDIQGLKIGGRASDALCLNWDKDGEASGYIIEQKENGSWRRIARIGSNSTDTFRIANLNASTTYQFRMKSFKYDGSSYIHGAYSYISGKTKPTVVSGVKIGGRAKDALRLNWNRDEDASGYIIEQYKNNQWTRIARIGKSTTTTYRVEGLDSLTTYKFRIHAFSFDGSTALHGSNTYISGKTRPDTVSEVKIGGHTKYALRINWKKDEKVSGYVVEQYKNGQWTRVVCIEDPNTTTYRISGLSPQTTYKFRVQSFGFDGTTPVYGAYGYVSGTTY